jgi:hypothetical protein
MPAVPGPSLPEMTFNGGIAPTVEDGDKTLFASQGEVVGLKQQTRLAQADDDARERNSLSNSDALMGGVETGCREVQGPKKTKRGCSENPAIEMSAEEKP